MSCCCNSLYSGLPCCCPSGTTTTTTLAPCEDAIVCDAAYVTDCVIYNGPVVSFDCLTINPGDDYTQILEGIISNLTPCTTTTTTTVAPTTTTTTTICQRPQGLLQFSFGSAIEVGGVPPSIDFTASQFDACLALYNFFNTPGSTISGFVVEAESMIIGDTVYDGRTGTDCTLVENGYYICTELSNTDVYHIENGIVAEILSCS